MRLPSLANAFTSSETPAHPSARAAHLPEEAHVEGAACSWDGHRKMTRD